MRNKNHINLVVFLTRGGSLELWSKKGILHREISLYLELRKFEISTTILTYGNKSDYNFAKDINEIQFVGNDLNLPLRVYEKMIPVLHLKTLRSANVFKTNQMNGSIAAINAARLIRRPVIARSGYLWSLDLEKTKGFDSIEADKARSIEERVWSKANLNVLTTQQMLDYSMEKSKADNKFMVIPNFVDVDKFTPDTFSTKNIDLLYIGRITYQKNLYSLIDAISNSHHNMTVIGDGDDAKNFERKIRPFQDRIRWIKKVQHDEIVSYMNSSRIFILPSFYEGHPKALLEAMSTGLAVIGADSPGINNLVIDGQNGLLCDGTSIGIKGSIDRVMKNDDLRHRLGVNARKFVESEFSLTSVAEKESEVIREVVNQV